MFGLSVGLVVGLTLGLLPAQQLLALIVRVLSHVTGSSPVRLRHVVEPGANVVLFVPIGLLLCWAVPGLSRWVLVAGCVVASLSIEVVQDLFLPDRTPSRVDVLTNGTGAALGALLHWVLSRWWAHRSRARHPVRRE